MRRANMFKHGGESGLITPSSNGALRGRRFRLIVERGDRLVLDQPARPRQPADHHQRARGGVGVLT